jgi:hypothetical protein
MLYFAVSALVLSVRQVLNEWKTACKMHASCTGTAALS